MRLHIDALVLLHRIWGAFGLLTGLSLLILAIGVAVALNTLDSSGLGRQPALWALAIAAAALMAAGAAALWTAGGLARGRPKARTAALVLAAPNLIVLPFGTAFGLYTFWVLRGDRARGEF